MTSSANAFIPRQEYRLDAEPAPSTVWVAPRAPARTLAGVLLAGALSAVLVAADTLIEAALGDHTVVAWMSLWMAVFITMALFAPTLRRWTGALARRIADRMQLERQLREEAQMWEFAHHDPRVMAEIRCARERAHIA